MPDPAKPNPDEAERLLKELEVRMVAQRAKNADLERRRSTFRALGIVIVILGLLALFAMMQAAPMLLRKPEAEKIAP